ncbi:Histone-binding protein RBBP4 or subunit C of CAF1 complex [Popillia japonica]|uniref:Glutamate-rich WD repeat-containing protein 1 n=1 Tax=Popillia japonica TaxID=7064 RepID=A0AAW1I8B0_POPJA
MSDNESMDIIDEENDSEMEEEKSARVDNDSDKEVYLPGKPLAEGEELVCDQTAYVMLHQAQTGAPCLSFDIINDNLGNNRETFPLTAYVVAGTQAGQAHINNIIVMKLSNLYATNKDDDEDDEDDDESDDESDKNPKMKLSNLYATNKDDDEDDEDDDESDDESDKNPKMAGALIKHQGCVNRIRSTTINATVLAASWSELGRVNVWNLTQQLQTVDSELLLQRYNKENKGNSVTPLFTFSGHQQEGFALDWCDTLPGTLATGDCKRDIHIWHIDEGGNSWKVDQRPLVGHSHSVEDLQWSPNERNVLASCSVDKSIRIWDTRAPPNKSCMITADAAHESDVNVISWNKNEPFIASGGDDGFLKVWDLRRFVDKTPVAIFKHHTAPVTSVEWHGTDSAVFASSGEDNQIALWDLSVEKDDNDVKEVEGIPPQLLFIHQGQIDIKELHWHPQLPGVIISTAASGFNIFRTISV